jgi:hypothetical protein
MELENETNDGTSIRGELLFRRLRPSFSPAATMVPVVARSKPPTMDSSVDLRNRSYR